MKTISMILLCVGFGLMASLPVMFLYQTEHADSESSLVDSAAPASSRNRSSPLLLPLSVRDALLVQEPDSSLHTGLMSQQFSTLRLPQDTVGYYTPDATSEPYGVLPDGTAYTLVARYGWEWVQADFAGCGRLWVPTSALAVGYDWLPALPNLAEGFAHTIQQVPAHLLQPGELSLRVDSEVAFFYAPGDGEQHAGMLATGTPYDLLGRYTWEWVQIDAAGTGVVWVRRADVGLAEDDMTSLTDLTPVGDYRGYTVAPGDTLEHIALMGGSDESLLRHYNGVQEPLVPGRALIVPRLEGRESSLPPGAALIVRKGTTPQPRVALTFDVEMGDISFLLEVLRQRGVPATFFVTGGWARSHPDMLRQIVADGHELGNHSNSHPDFRRLHDNQIAYELAETERVVQELTGATTRPFFRPPFGGYDERVLRAVIREGYLPVYWTLDSQDAIGAPKSAHYFLHRLTEGIPAEDLPGTIVLSHCCGQQHRVPEALWAILDRFDEMGIEVCPLSEVL